MADFSQVRVHIDLQPAAFGASAMAFGNEVFVCPQVWESSKESLFRVLAHECAHVLQQREGRVRPRVWRHGAPFCLDWSLELEAEAGAMLAMRGERVASRRRRSGARFRPALQPLISLNGQLVKFAIKSSAENKRTISTNLSEKFVRVLNFVPGSSDWLDWAANKSTQTYSAENELVLLLEMIEGLHNTPLVRLPALPLTIHTSRLWELSTDDFFTLTQSFKGNAQKSGAEAVMAAHGFQKQDTLASTLAYFQQLTDAPGLWSEITLADQLSLQSFYVGAKLETLSKAALAGMTGFAIEKAQHAGELADCCQFYLSATPSSSLTADKKAAATQAWQTWDDVAPFAVRYLNSPSFGVHWQRNHFHLLLRNWIETGGQIGFPTLPSAALNILKNPCRRRSPGKTADVESSVVKYMTAAQALLYSGHPVAQGLSQDGETRRFVFQNGGQRAVLAVDSYGTATIESFAE